MKKSLSIPKEVIEQLQTRQKSIENLEGHCSFSHAVTLHLEYALKHDLETIAPYMEVNM